MTCAHDDSTINIVIGIIIIINYYYPSERMREMTELVISLVCSSASQSCAVDVWLYDARARRLASSASACVYRFVFQTILKEFKAVESSPTSITRGCFPRRRQRPGHILQPLLSASFAPLQDPSVAQRLIASSLHHHHHHLLLLLVFYGADFHFNDQLSPLPLAVQPRAGYGL